MVSKWPRLLIFETGSMNCCYRQHDCISCKDGWLTVDHSTPPRPQTNTCFMLMQWMLYKVCLPMCKICRVIASQIPKHLVLQHVWIACLSNGDKETFPLWRIQSLHTIAFYLWVSSCALIRTSEKTLTKEVRVVAIRWVYMFPIEFCLSLYLLHTMVITRCTWWWMKIEQIYHRVQWSELV